MDLSQIKNFVKQNGDKFILMENGEPEIVVMSFREYERLTNGGSAGGNEEFRKPPHRGYPRDFRAEERRFEETEFIPPSGLMGSLPPARVEDVRLEDLPL